MYSLELGILYNGFVVDLKYLLVLLSSFVYVLRAQVLQNPFIKIMETFSISQKWDIFSI